MAQLVPARQAQVRVSSLPLYDTCLITAVASTVTAQQIRLFQNGVGSNADGFTSKDLTNTNLTRQGGVALGQSMAVHSIGCGIWFNSVDAATSSTPIGYDLALDAANIARGAVLKYTSGELSQTFGPLAFFPEGGGPVVNAISTGATSISTGAIPNNGLQTPQARFRLVEPIQIEDGQSFAFVVDIPTALTFASGVTSAFKIQISLYGITYQTVTQ